ncbi:MAG: hypothetical protein JOS17DRAFT_777165 [Linnemannia elongata]|nr:MAG: hypothetical protein JOS17DRAFT_777165 [Linnemannia elongata]
MTTRILILSATLVLTREAVSQCHRRLEGAHLQVLELLKLLSVQLYDPVQLVSPLMILRTPLRATNTRGHTSFLLPLAFPYECEGLANEVLHPDRLATIDPTITATGAAESEPEGLPPEPGGPGSVDPIEPDGAVACTEILDPKELVVSSSGFAPDVFVEFGLPPEPVVVVVAVPELEVDDLSLEELACYAES